MNTTQYKQSSIKLKEFLEYISFLNNGLYRNENKMYPVKFSDRLNIIIKLWKN